MGVEQVAESLWTGFRGWPVWVQVLGWVFFWWLLVLPLIWRSRLGMPVKAIISLVAVGTFLALAVSGGNPQSVQRVAIPVAEPDPAASAAGSSSPDAPPTASTPKLTGLRAAKATDRVSELSVHVVLNVTYRYSAKPAGTVLHQSPAIGETIAAGSVVHLIVAKPFPKIPSVVGKSVKKAEHILRTAGYKVKVVRRVSSRRVGTVVGESPSGGNRAKQGTVVTIAVAKAAPPPPPTIGGGSGGGGSNCTPGYSPCLPLGPSDYDCAGGSGNGPAYTTPGVVYRVTGYDRYGLDADHDGYGCE